MAAVGLRSRGMKISAAITMASLDENRDPGEVGSEYGA